MSRNKATKVEGFAIPEKISREVKTKQIRCSEDTHDAIARIADDNLTTMTATMDALVNMYESHRKAPTLKKES